MSNEPSYILPENWNENELERLIASGTKITYGVVQPGEQDPNGVPFIRGGDIYNGKIAIGKLRTISQTVSASYKRTLLQGGELLMSLVGYPGEVAIVPKMLAGANIARQAAYIKLGQSVDSKYVMYYLQSDLGKYYLFQKSTGSAQQVINLVDLKDVKVVLPPLLEQQKIAAILTSVDEVIENTQAQINKLKDLKTGMMQELLTRGVGVDGKPHTELKDSPVGRIPEEWEVKSIGTLVSDKIIDSIQDGNHGEKHPKSADFVSRGIPFVMASDIHNQTIDIEGANKIPLDIYIKLRIGFAKAGDVLLSHKATVGLTAVVPDSVEQLMLTPQVTYYRIGNTSKLSNIYLHYAFQSSYFQESISLLSAQSTRSYIGIKAQRELEIVMPNTIEEQEKIVEVLRSIDNKINLVKSKLIVQKNTKKALMQDLLTGKVRVKVEG